MPSVGDIWLDLAYPVAEGTKPKYLLLAAVEKYDIAYCTTTSRPHGRSTDPACFYGNPYAAFFLGDPPPSPFPKPGWLDLQHYVESLDPLDFRARVASGQLLLKGALAPPLLCEAIKCMRGRSPTRLAKMLDAALKRVGCPP
jgi:hypothetical protein